MLEQETERILGTLTLRTIGGRDTITLGEVLRADIPQSVKAYMRAEVIRALEHDAATMPSLGRIDRSNPGIDRLTRHFFRTIADQYLFPRSDFLVILDHAVHFAENYLCRPQWTLRSFLFGDLPRAEPATILAQLDSLAEYEYFPELIRRMLRGSASPVSAEAFSALLTTIDDQVVRQHSSGELARLLKPIFDFLLLTDAGEDAAVPVGAILVFLDDKKLKALREYVENVCRIRNTGELTLAGLASLIDDLYTGQTGDIAAPAQRHEEVSVAEPSVHTPEMPAPRAPGPSEEVRSETPPTSEPGRVNFPLSLTFSGMSEHPPVEPPTAHGLPDLKVTIGADQQDQYVRKIFMNDYDYYATVIAALNSFATWEEAGSYLERLYELNGLNPSRPEVAEFTAAVRRRYPGPGSEPG